MNAYAYVPFNLEFYAESILPVTGIDMQALCTCNNCIFGICCLGKSPVMNYRRPKPKRKTCLEQGFLIAVWLVWPIDELVQEQVQVNLGHTRELTCLKRCNLVDGARNSKDLW